MTTLVSLEDFKRRLRNVGWWLCDIDGHCESATVAVFEEFDLGDPGNSEETHTLKISISSIDGVAILPRKKALTITLDGEGYTSEGALIDALIDGGWLHEDDMCEFFSLPDPPDPADDVPEVAALKEFVRQFAADNAGGEVSTTTINKYLRYLGIEELPIDHKFVFKVMTTMPLTYEVVAASEEEALPLLNQKVEDDNQRTAQGWNRIEHIPVGCIAQTGSPVFVRKFERTG